MLDGLDVRFYVRREEDHQVAGGNLHEDSPVKILAGLETIPGKEDLMIRVAERLNQLADGRTHYPIPGNTRSLEGSTAFLGVAFVCVFVLLYWSGISVGEAMMLSLCVALVAAVVEAVSPHATDNLTVPLASWLAFDACVLGAGLSFG